MISTVSNARVLGVIIAFVIQGCNAEYNILLAQKDIPLQEPSTVSLTPSTVIQVYGKFNSALAFSQWENFILIYDQNFSKLKEAIILTDDVAKRIFPGIGEEPRRYKYSPEDEKIFLMPYPQQGNALTPEIMTARMISEDVVACVAFVKGPWQIEREENNQGIGLVPALITYDVRLKKLLDVTLLLPWLPDYTWNSAIISNDGSRVVIGMTGDRNSKNENSVKIFEQDVRSDEIRVIYEAEAETGISQEFLFSWDADSLLCSIDLRSILSLNGNGSSVCVSEEALNDHFKSAFRLTSATIEPDGSIAMGVYVEMAEKKIEAHCLLAQGDSVITDQTIDISVPGKVCYVTAHADSSSGLMFWIDNERAYIRNLVWR